MRTILFRLFLLFQGTRISPHTSIIGTSRIYIGNDCRINPYCYLKGEPPSGKLWIGSNVVINRFSHISAKNSVVKIGENGYIGYNNWIGGKGNITIGKNFMSGMNVVIISSNHDYHKIQIPYHAGNEIAEDIVIGENVWIGANSTILPGVKIGSGAVIGAGSVVSHDISDNMLVTGAPAKVNHEIHRVSNPENAT